MLENNQITKEQSRFIVASTASQSGKTILTVGLLRALENRKKTVQMFKSGPDLVDSKYFELASNRDSYNLDSFMQSELHMKDIYAKYSADADVCIIEGYKALFDGYDKIKGSTAHIAELTHTPVILVVDVSREAYSVSAQIYGYLNFRKSIKIVGVVLNFVKSEGHLKSLKDACEDIGVRVLGYLYQDDLLDISLKTHIGDTIVGKTPFQKYVNILADVVSQSVDIDLILQLTTSEVTYQVPMVQPEEEIEQTFTVAVAYDKAFCFYYNQNLQLFRKKSRVVFFSPVEDKELPEADIVYLPSGFFEYYLAELSANKSMMNSIRQYIENGGFLLAESSGMLYLSEAMTNSQGVRYPMIGIFSQEGTFENKDLVTGYRSFDFENQHFKGYEHHWSHLSGSDKKNMSDIVVHDILGKPTSSNFYRYKNAVVSYTHIYWAERGLTELFALLWE